MNTHKNARSTPHGRAEMVRRVLEEGQSRAQVGVAMGFSARTVGNWVRRFQEEGVAGLESRSSRPHRLRAPTCSRTKMRIIALRRYRMTGTRSAAETGVSGSTVSRVLRAAGLSRLKDLEPAPPAQRYERARPGEMLHMDIKKLGRFNSPGHRVTGDRTKKSARRGVGWEYVHVAIDDHSRLAFTDILPDESTASAIAFLHKAVAWYAWLGVRVERLMTDNGGCYRSKAFRTACRELGIRQIFTRPYTPRTNGKAERFIKTALSEWAYARAYGTSRQRGLDLPVWTHDYNWHRPHGAIGSMPPISRIKIGRNNLLTMHT